MISQVEPPMPQPCFSQSFKYLQSTSFSKPKTQFLILTCFNLEKKTTKKQKLSLSPCSPVNPCGFDLGLTETLLLRYALYLGINSCLNLTSKSATFKCVAPLNLVNRHEPLSDNIQMLHYVSVDMQIMLVDMQNQIFYFVYISKPEIVSVDI